jgi:hypothetical protein
MDKRTSRKAFYAAISAISILMIGAMSAPSVHASSFHMTKKSIYINESLFSAPNGFVARDPASNKPTTYLPIWYIQQLLQKSFGITQTWDGHSWKLDIPSSYSLSSFTPVVPSRDTAKRVVYLNNQAFECPNAIVTTDLSSNQPTTYFPMWYIERVLHLIGIQDTWDGTSWNMTEPNSGQASDTQSTSGSSGTSGSSSGSGSTGASGSQSTSGTSSASGSASNSSSSASSGNSNSSDTTLSATDSNSGTSSSGETPTTQVSAKVQLQNAAVDDSSWWARANSDYYVAAQTANPLTNPDPVVGSKILNAEPGDKLYLFSYSGNANVPRSMTTWAVNSTDATVTPDGQDWQVGQYDAAGAVFVATKPGVYTVQADINDTYSVPLVITVGFDSLKSQSMATSVDIQGIRPMPTGLVSEQTQDNGTGTSYTLYAANGNWIPISGKTSSGVKFVTVVFGGDMTNPIWSYNIPVQSDGSFSAEVKSPVAGETNIYLYTNYINDLTSLGNGQNISETPVHFTVQLPSDAVNLPISDLDLMPSAKMDFNLSPVFAETAATLYENAPTVDSGIAAINNYASDYMTYDMSELQPNLYRFQDSMMTWNSKTGICEDYAELEASMLKSIGIRAETILGVVSDSTTGNQPANANNDNHEWLKAWDGTKWIIADPTWSSEDESNTALVTNEFFTDTQSFDTTHTTDSNGIGTTFSRIQGR